EVPGAAGADMLDQRMVPVLRQDQDVHEAGVDAVGEREVDDPVLPRERNGRLRPLVRQNAEARPLSARKDDGPRLHRASLFIRGALKLIQHAAPAPARRARRTDPPTASTKNRTACRAVEFPPMIAGER